MSHTVATRRVYAVRQSRVFTNFMADAQNTFMINVKGGRAGSLGLNTESNKDHDCDVASSPN